MSEQRDEEQSAQQRERNDFYLGRSRRAKGGLGEKAVVEEISSLRGGVRERADAGDQGSPRGEHLVCMMWWVLKIRM